MHAKKLKTLLRASAAAAFVGGIALSFSSTSEAFPVTATEGVHMAYLSTGPGSQPPNPSIAPPLFDGAVLSLTFDVDEFLPNNIGGGTSTIFPGAPTLLFDINVLTSENPEGTTSNDLFAVSLDGNLIAGGAVGGFVNEGGFALSPISEPFDNIPMIGPDGSFFGFGETGFVTVSETASASTTTIATSITSGVHTLLFGVADDENPLGDTALLIDNIRLSFDIVDLISPQSIHLGEILIEGFEDIVLEPVDAPGIQPAAATTGQTQGNVSIVVGPDFTQPIPEPATLSLVGAGLFGLGATALRRRRKTQK